MLATYSKFYSHRKYSPIQHDLLHEENTLHAPSTTPRGHQTYSSTNNTYFADRHQTISPTLHGYLSLYTPTTVAQFHHYCIIISYNFIMIASLFHTIASFKLFNHPTPGDLYTSMTESIPLSILKQYRTEQ